MMKGLPIIFLAALVALASSFELSYDLPNTDPWFVPSLNNGSFIWETRKQVQDELSRFIANPGKVEYYLYTNDNPTDGKKLDYDDPDSLKRSNFKSSTMKYTNRLVIHGFKSSSDSPLCSMIVSADLKNQRNMICVDWAEMAGGSYGTARFVVNSIAKDVVKFINFLMEHTKMNYKDLHIIGHSLGAHVAGIAGKELKKQNKPLSLIVGLDPALPLFSYDDCSTRLCNSDADNVQSIQTNGGKLGFLRPIGGLAFYPNGGVAQPNCGLDLTGSCAHSRSYIYLAEAIWYDNFMTVKCEGQLGYLNAIAKNCGSKFSEVRMGELQSIGHQGVYYVPINSQSPYGVGEKKMPSK